MAQYTITSNPEQDVALSLMAAGQKISNQQLLNGLVNDMLVGLINTQKQNLLNAIQEDSLETLEGLSAQSPQAEPIT